MIDTGFPYLLASYDSHIHTPQVVGLVGQGLQKDSPLAARAFDTFAGWRPSEPCTLSSLAVHQTLSELLLYTARRIRALSPTAPAAMLFGLSLSERDLEVSLGCLT